MHAGARALRELSASSSREACEKKPQSMQACGQLRQIHRFKPPSSIGIATQHQTLRTRGWPLAVGCAPALDWNRTVNAVDRHQRPGLGWWLSEVGKLFGVRLQILKEALELTLH